MAELETITLPIEPDLSAFSELGLIEGGLVHDAAKAAREHNVTVTLTITPAG